MMLCRCLYTDRLRMPLAETQMATVLSNADPHGAGRVQVRMNWQTDNMRTSWVRVMTPDGGGSKDVKSNRGFVFIPEEATKSSSASAMATPPAPTSWVACLMEQQVTVEGQIIVLKVLRHVVAFPSSSTMIIGHLK